jgi:hypothetical protein
VEAQQRTDEVSTRPDRWIVSTISDRASGEPTSRMLYLARDGTVLIVQCAARDGRKTGGWAFMVRRDDWEFSSEFLEGWWSVDAEPANGPLQWGGAGSIVMLNEDTLRDRLQEPVEEQIRFRVVRGAREWNVQLGVRDLAPSVEQFAPSCRAT